MLISLRGDHKEHLNLLATQPNDVMIDFCKLAIDFLQNGPNDKLYSTAAEKLSVTGDVVQNCIFGLVNLLLLSYKYKLTETDFRDSLLTLGFNAEQQEILLKFNESNKKDLVETMSKLKLNSVHYHDLIWRFEVQVGSRALLHQITPLITMELILKKMDNTGNNCVKNTTFLQTDITNLVHITQQLESALNESRTKHSRKIQRSLDMSSK